MATTQTEATSTPSTTWGRAETCFTREEEGTPRSGSEHARRDGAQAHSRRFSDTLATLAKTAQESLVRLPPSLRRRRSRLRTPHRRESRGDTSSSSPPSRWLFPPDPATTDDAASFVLAEDTWMPVLDEREVSAASCTGARTRSEASVGAPEEMELWGCADSGETDARREDAPTKSDEEAKQPQHQLSPRTVAQEGNATRAALQHSLDRQREGLKALMHHQRVLHRALWVSGLSLGPPSVAPTSPEETGTGAPDLETARDALASQATSCSRSAQQPSASRSSVSPPSPRFSSGASHRVSCGSFPSSGPMHAPSLHAPSLHAPSLHAPRLAAGAFSPPTGREPVEEARARGEDQAPASTDRPAQVANVEMRRQQDLLAALLTQQTHLQEQLAHLLHPQPAPFPGTWNPADQLFLRPRLESSSLPVFASPAFLPRSTERFPPCCPWPPEATCAPPWPSPTAFFPSLAASSCPPAPPSSPTHLFPHEAFVPRSSLSPLAPSPLAPSPWSYTPYPACAALGAAAGGPTSPSRSSPEQPGDSLATDEDRAEATSSSGSLALPSLAESAQEEAPENAHEKRGQMLACGDRRDRLELRGASLRSSDVLHALFEERVAPPDAHAGVDHMRPPPEATLCSPHASRSRHGTAVNTAVLRSAALSRSGPAASGIADKAPEAAESGDATRRMPLAPRAAAAGTERLDAKENATGARCELGDGAADPQFGAPSGETKNLPRAGDAREKVRDDGFSTAFLLSQQKLLQLQILYLQRQMEEYERPGGRGHRGAPVSRDRPGSSSGSPPSPHPEKAPAASPAAPPAASPAAPPAASPAAPPAASPAAPPAASPAAPPAASPAAPPAAPPLESVAPEPLERTCREGGARLPGASAPPERDTETGPACMRAGTRLFPQQRPVIVSFEGCSAVCSPSAFSSPLPASAFHTPPEGAARLPAEGHFQPARRVVNHEDQIVPSLLKKLREQRDDPSSLRSSFPPATPARLAGSCWWDARRPQKLGKKQRPTETDTPQNSCADCPFSSALSCPSPPCSASSDQTDGQRKRQTNFLRSRRERRVDQKEIAALGSPDISKVESRVKAFWSGGAVDDASLQIPAGRNRTKTGTREDRLASLQALSGRGTAQQPDGAEQLAGRRSRLRQRVVVSLPAPSPPRSSSASSACPAPFSLPHCSLAEGNAEGQHAQEVGEDGSDMHEEKSRSHSTGAHTAGVQGHDGETPSDACRPTEPRTEGRKSGDTGDGDVGESVSSPEKRHGEKHHETDGAVSPRLNWSKETAELLREFSEQQHAIAEAKKERRCASVRTKGGSRVPFISETSPFFQEQVSRLNSSAADSLYVATMHTLLQRYEELTDVA
ncbi:conserved hypothetical protein [Neospora caninum Liverpool]|uniref:Uncharacterized protein n=1 Tax=Neospora caninum (strain Liverpool) TaxID=572307 RepID=F0VEC3_NEOCL|nr:conserved hypothetical protein [Neospora caninum Liverpool]CBZ52067.1 conserved hypothetical protein [Neospora caninum Liverpool]|eukprot:XP_003882099.1 conserved hypothetical protein [Neospora caninum Liverpool]